MSAPRKGDFTAVAEVLEETATALRGTSNLGADSIERDGLGLAVVERLRRKYGEEGLTLALMAARLRDWDADCFPEPEPPQPVTPLEAPVTLFRVTVLVDSGPLAWAGFVAEMKAMGLAWERLPDPRTGLDEFDDGSTCYVRIDGAEPTVKRWLLSSGKKAAE